MSGHPNFERHVRVQENTVEQLVIFLPALFLFAIVWLPLHLARHGDLISGIDPFLSIVILGVDKFPNPYSGFLGKLPLL